ncbi:hypothetical protein B0J13DRAFT_252523 [Dactylonectria estremocensis]|uniref:BZIP domain-containing protein n=1 Tax=Dactylonectria estremocensis TaxID=1079267 RepID=A0A9P9F4A5_9HYPO|nr:hypothetical protein B0J13DRAFT_252523 [Dactylonectria estremocensis]
MTPETSQSSRPPAATASQQPEAHVVENHRLEYYREIASTSSASFSRSYADGSELSCPAQYPPIDAMDKGAFHQFNALTGEPTLDPFNVPPDLPWDQWWSIDQSVLIGSLQDRGGITPASTQTNFLPNRYACGYDTNSLGDSTWPSPNTEYTPMTSVAEQTVFQESTASVNRLELPVTEKEPGLERQKRDSDEHPTRNITKRGSVQNDEIKAQLPRDSEHSKGHRDSGGSSGSSKHNSKSDNKCDINNTNKDKNSNKSTSKDEASKNDDKSNNRDCATSLNSGGGCRHNERIQQRNKIASSKFRAKKKGDELKLKSEVEEMERINRDLSSRVANLTHDVYLLKMQVLQHADDCNCSMIQEYIKHEAHRYAMAINEPSPNEGHHHQQP